VSKLSVSDSIEVLQAACAVIAGVAKARRQERERCMAVVVAIKERKAKNRDRAAALGRDHAEMTCSVGVDVCEEILLALAAESSK
jgi:hypothetical protein